MTDTNLYMQRLFEANPLREPTLHLAIQKLQLPLGSRGLDVGCGIGLQTKLLAKAVGSDGHITGLDILPELLMFGEDFIREAGLSEQVTFQEGDMSCLPFADNTFDWVWSADCIGYPVGELSPILKELMRVVKPEGSIIILAWTSQQVLPGHPLLEARLNASCSSYLPYLKGKNPESHFLRMMHGFRQVGLEDIKAHTFVGEVQDPLGDEERIALTSLFEMLWGQPQPECSPVDWQEFKRLCSAESTDFILNIQDYYAFFTYSMFQGKCPVN